MEHKHVCRHVSVEVRVQYFTFCYVDPCGDVCKHHGQEGSLVQQDLVASFGSNFESLTLRSLFQAYLNAAQFWKKFPGDN